MKRLLSLALAALLLCSACQRAEKEKTVVKDEAFRLLVRVQQKYGYCDSKGTMVIPAQYDNAALLSFL